MKRILLVLFVFITHLPAHPTDVREAQKVELYIETAHTSNISSLAYSPDGKLLASAGSDDTVKLWDAATRRELKTFYCGGREGFSGAFRGATSVSFSPDSKHIALGCQYRVAMWNVVNGTQSLTIPTGLDEVAFVTFSPDGKTLATGINQEIKIWDAGGGQLLKTLKGHTNYITEIAFSPTGEVIASVAGDEANGDAVDNRVLLWDAASGKLLRKLEGHKGNVYSVKFSPDGKTIVSCSLDSTKTWDAASGKQIWSDDYEAYTGFKSVGFSPDGQSIIGAGGAIFVWDAAGKQRTATYKKAGDVFAVAPDGKTLASARLQELMFWDRQSGTLITSLKPRTSEAGKVISSPNPGQFATVHENGEVMLWSTRGANLLTSFKGHDSPIETGAFTSDGKLFVTAARSTIKLWDGITGQPVAVLQATNPKESIRTLKINPNNRTLATASYRHTAVKLWSLETHQEIRVLNGHTKGPAFLAFSKDGKYLVSGGSDEKILWNADTGEQVERFGDSREARAKLDKLVPEYHEQFQPLYNPYLKPDQSKYQITQVENGRLVLTELQSNRMLATILPLEGNRWVAAAPDGRFDTNQSLDGIQGLHWIVNDEFTNPLPLDVFMRQYYEPGLVQRVLKCTKEKNCEQEFKPLPSIAEINRVQPHVAVKEVRQTDGSADTVDVTVEVESVTDDVSVSAIDRTKRVKKTSGVFDLRLFRDAQLVGVSAPKEKLEEFIKHAPRLVEETRRSGRLLDTPEDAAWREANALIDAGARDGKTTYTFRNIKLPADGRGLVEFTAYAFNSDRVKSRTTDPFKFAVPKTVAAQARRPRAVIVSIGVNASETPAYNLRYAANDTREMQEIVGERLKADGPKYSEVVAVPLISDYGTDKQLAENAAQKVIIRSVFALLAGRDFQDVLAELSQNRENPRLAEEFKRVPNIEKLKAIAPEDTLIITYSGHGYADRSGIFYLVPYDIGKDTRVLTTETLRRTISSDELSLWLQGITAAEMIFIIDACYSAAAVQGDGFKPGPMGSRGLGQLAYDKDIKILSATQADNVALELGSLSHGILSYALLQDGIRGGLADTAPKDKQLSAAEWLSFAEKRVPELYQEVADGKRGVIVNGEKIEDKAARERELLGTERIQLSGLNLQQPTLFDFRRRQRKDVLFLLP